MASTAIRAIGCAVASDMSCFENMEEVVLSPQTMAQLPRLGGTVSQSRGRLAPIQRSLLKKPLKEQVGLFTEYTRSLDARMETMLELERRNESTSGIGPDLKDFRQRKLSYVQPSERRCPLPCWPPSAIE